MRVLSETEIRSFIYPRTWINIGASSYLGYEELRIEELRALDKRVPVFAKEIKKVMEKHLKRSEKEQRKRLEFYK